MELNDKQAYMHGAKMGAEYLKEIGKTDLAAMTPAEVLVFSEVVCKNYHFKKIELDSQINV